MSRKTVLYYQDARGSIPVVKFLDILPADDREKALAYVGYLQEQGELLRRPIAEYLGDKLYELRPKHVRILYAFVGKHYAVMLHAFWKKTGSVPAVEKHMALSRLADFVQRYEKGMMVL